MTRVRHLQPLPALHDLPCSWDGRVVEWGEWSTAESSIRFHEIVACEHCGVIGEPHIALGRRHPPLEAPDDARPMLELVVFRCPDCQHDRVHDRVTEEAWDLEPEDYSAAGSSSAGTLW